MWEREMMWHGSCASPKKHNTDSSCCFVSHKLNTICSFFLQLFDFKLNLNMPDASRYLLLIARVWNNPIFFFFSTSSIPHIFPYVGYTQRIECFNISIYFFFLQLITALSFILGAFSTTAQSLWPNLSDKCGSGGGGKLKYLSGDALTDSLNCIGPNHLPYPHAMINRAFSNSGTSRRGRQSSHFTQPTLDPVVMQSTLLNAYKEVNGESSSSLTRQGKVKLQRESFRYSFFFRCWFTQERRRLDGPVRCYCAQKKRDEEEEVKKRSQKITFQPSDRCPIWESLVLASS